LRDHAAHHGIIVPEAHRESLAVQDTLAHLRPDQAVELLRRRWPIPLGAPCRFETGDLRRTDRDGSIGPATRPIADQPVGKADDGADH